MNTEEFSRRYLYDTPLRERLEAMHVMARYMGASGDALAVFEHHLNSVAAYTRRDERERYYTSAEYHAEETRRRQETLINQPLTTPEKFFPPDFNLAASLKKAVDDMSGVLKNMRAKRTPEQQERISEALYRQRIKAERKKGVAHVRAEAARVRKELGL